MDGSSGISDKRQHNGYVRSIDAFDTAVRHLLVIFILVIKLLKQSATVAELSGRTCTLVSALLGFIALLVGLRAVLVRLLILVGKFLPLLAENLSDLACNDHVSYLGGQRRAQEIEEYSPNLMPGFSSRTLSRLSLAKNM
jgi:hypothetical protein